MAAGVGDEVQIREWIGDVIAVRDGLVDIEWWQPFGGPFGSSVTRNVPAAEVHVRRRREGEG